MLLAQVDDAGKSALDYAQDAGHRSTWLLLWQAHQENATKERLVHVELLKGAAVAGILSHLVRLVSAVTAAALQVMAHSPALYFIAGFTVPCRW